MVMCLSTSFSYVLLRLTQRHRQLSSAPLDDRLARKLGRDLAGVRGTSGTMVDKSLLGQLGMFNPTGVCKELVWNVRRALDAEGFDYVKIIVSGGFNPARIREFEAAGVPVDTYAVGSSLFDGNINFTADMVLVDGEGIVPTGDAGICRIRAWNLLTNTKALRHAVLFL